MSAADANECLHCHGGLAPQEACCSVCGTLRGASSPPPKPAQSARAKDSRGVIDNPYAVLAAVFLAIAVFGIPLIWMCRAWSPATKTLLTIVTILYTILLFWGFWLIMVWVWERIGPDIQAWFQAWFQ